jgi:hypothetical protein
MQQFLIKSIRKFASTLIFTWFLDKNWNDSVLWQNFNIRKIFAENAIKIQYDVVTRC